MKLCNRISIIGITTAALLFSAGCNQGDYPRTAQQDTVGQTARTDLDENRMDLARAETGRYETTQYDMTRTNSDNLRDMDDEELADFDYSDREVSAMTLPELNEKVGEVNNRLQETRPMAQSRDRMDDFDELQERTTDVAEDIQEAQLEAPSDDDSLEMTRDILEVEAEVADFNDQLSQNL